MDGWQKTPGMAGFTKNSLNPLLLQQQEKRSGLKFFSIQGLIFFLTPLKVFLYSLDRKQTCRQRLLKRHEPDTEFMLWNLRRQSQ